MPRKRSATRWAIVLATAVLWSTAPAGASFFSVTLNASSAFSAASSFYRAQVLSSSPVAYWRLGESSGTTAATEVGTSNGTYAGGCTLGRPSALAWDTNTSVEFDGTSCRISVPHSSAINFATQVSIEAWVKPDTVTGTRYILNKGTLYFLYISNNTTFFGVRSGGGHVFIQSTGLVTTGSWQHLVGTYDASKAVLYRNGVQAVQASFSGPIDTGTAQLFVGSFDATVNYWDGMLDEVALYGRGLTAAEVQAHYARGV